ncbi:MAG: hypothetical protein IJ608_02360 [Lachnospiraceae bacterium]|nr:hypothetical protein [Lachnospiraceae bacterium]
MKLKNIKLDYIYFSYILLGIMFLINIVYFAVNGDSLLDSDMSTEMVYSALLNKTGGVINDNWYFSTELYIFYSYFIMRAGLFLFPANWHLARLFTIIISMIILCLVTFFIMNMLGYRRVWAYAAAMVICPISAYYYYLVLLGDFYIFNISISVITVAMLFVVLKSDKLHIRILLTALAGGISFLISLSGVKELLIAYVPFFIACVFNYILKDFFKLKDKEDDVSKLPAEIWALIYSGVCVAAGGLGMELCYNVLSRKYAFVNYTGDKWSEFSISNMLVTFGDFLSIFGWNNNVEITSLKGIMNVLSIAFSLLILVFAVVFTCKIKKLALNERIFVLFFDTAWLFQFFVYSQNERHNQYFWTQIMPYSLILFFIGAYHFIDRLKPLNKYLMYICLCGYLIVMSRETLIINPKMDINGGMYYCGNMLEAVDYIKENGLENGFATFWNSGVVTELTDGKTEMWTVGVADFNTIYPWLQKKEHSSVFPEGEVFALLDIYDYNAGCLDADDKIVYSDGDYYIYLFDDMEDFRNAVQ